MVQLQVAIFAIVKSRFQIKPKPIKGSSKKSILIFSVAGMSRDNDESKWWPVLYVGKAAKKDEEGSYVWKLRDELAEALGRVDLSKVNLYANLEPNFWKISHGNDCISDVEAAAFEKRQVIVVHKDTAARVNQKSLRAKILWLQ